MRVFRDSAGNELVIGVFYRNGANSKIQYKGFDPSTGKLKFTSLAGRLGDPEARLISTLVEPGDFLRRSDEQYDGYVFSQESDEDDDGGYGGRRRKTKTKTNKRKTRRNKTNKRKTRRHKSRRHRARRN
jgi:hypothetical protein